MSGAEQIDFEQRLAAFDYDAKSYSTFPMVKRAIERHAPAALAALYRHIANTSQIRGMFSSQARMDHARDKQMEHWRKLFSRPLDHDYAASSTHIGRFMRGSGWPRPGISAAMPGCWNMSCPS